MRKRRKRLKQRGRSKPHKLLARKQQLRAAAAKVSCESPVISSLRCCTTQQQKRERERTVAEVAEVVKPVDKKYPSVLNRFK